MSRGAARRLAAAAAAEAATVTAAAERRPCTLFVSHSPRAAAARQRDDAMDPGLGLPGPRPGAFEYSRRPPALPRCSALLLPRRSVLVRKRTCPAGARRRATTARRRRAHAQDASRRIRCCEAPRRRWRALAEEEACRPPRLRSPPARQRDADREARARPAHGAPAGEMAAACNGGNNDANHLGLVATRVTAREAVAQLAEQGPTS